MTDRQTDNRSGCWSITAFDEDDINRLAGDYPSFVKHVWGGLEECPSTGKKHYQGAVETSYCRFSQIKKWLPKAHIEKCIKKEALIDYVMKDETAIGEKSKQSNSKYISLEKFMELIAFNYINSKDEEIYYATEIENKMLYFKGKMENSIEVPGYQGNYWTMVNKVLLHQPYLCHIAFNPNTLRGWSHTSETWIQIATSNSEIYNSTDRQTDNLDLGTNPV